MHEIGIARDVVQIVERAAREHGMTAVRGVVLEIGRLSGVDAQSLRFALEAAGPGTLLDGASIELVEPPLLLRCGSCGGERESDLEEAVCPVCGSSAFSVERGRELLVRSIEGE